MYGLYLGAEIWSGNPHYMGSDRFLSVNAVMKGNMKSQVEASCTWLNFSDYARNYGPSNVLKMISNLANLCLCQER